MMKRNGHKIKGFTLMELMVTVGILGMIIVTIMGMFFRSFRGGTKADTIMTLDQNAQMSLSILERFVRNAQSVSVGGGDCPATSDSLTVESWDGRSTVFSLENGQLASNGAVISGEAVVISDLVFECVRTQGIPDQVMVRFNAVRTDAGGGAETEASYESVINLRNY